MKKKVLLVAVLLAMVMVIPSMVIAAYVNVNWGTYVGGNGGGEFLLTSLDDKTSKDFFNPFNSFCLEKLEYINPGASSKYSWELSNAAIEGGVSGSSDPISKGTAFLFRNFAFSGLIQNSNYDAGILQETIWYLEEEQTNAPSDTKYLLTVLSEFNDLTSARVDANGAYSVGVLNLKNLDGSRAQDMLAYGVGSNVPIPPTAYLLGAGLLGLVGLRRRFRK